VSTKPITIGSVLPNHKVAAATFNYDVAPVCYCHLHPCLAKDAQGHVACRGSDPLAMHFYGDILGDNLSTALLPTNQQLFHILLRNFQKFNHSFLQPILANDVEFIAGNIWFDPSVLLWDFVELHPFPTALTIQNALAIRDQLTGLIISPLDRNTNACFIQCHYKWSQKFRKLYHDDSHYEHIPGTERVVLQQMKQSYSRSGFSAYFGRASPALSKDQYIIYYLFIFLLTSCVCACGVASLKVHERCSKGMAALLNGCVCRKSSRAHHPTIYIIPYCIYIITTQT